MKKVLFFISLCFLLQVSIVCAAQYKVQDGDVIGVVAQKTNRSIEQLAVLNHIEAPEYTVRIGMVLRYASDDDIRRARLWIVDYMASLLNESDEYKSFTQMLQNIDANNIQYDDTQSGTYASEIILLANAYQLQ